MRFVFEFFNFFHFEPANYAIIYPGEYPMPRERDIRQIVLLPCEFIVVLVSDYDQELDTNCIQYVLKYISKIIPEDEGNH